MSYRLGQDGPHWTVINNSGDIEVFRSLRYGEAQTVRDGLNAPTGGASVVYKTDVVRIAHADILLLPTVPIDVTPAASEGKFNLLLFAQARAHLVAPYTNVGAHCGVYIGGIDPEADDWLPGQHIFAAGGLGPNRAVVIGGFPVPRLRLMLNTTLGGAFIGSPININVYNGDADDEDLGNLTGGDPENWIEVETWRLEPTAGEI